jgi:hypothetical protein
LTRRQYPPESGFAAERTSVRGAAKAAGMPRLHVANEGKAASGNSMTSKSPPTCRGLPASRELPTALRRTADEGAESLRQQDFGLQTLARHHFPLQTLTLDRKGDLLRDPIDDLHAAGPVPEATRTIFQQHDPEELGLDEQWNCDQKALCPA